MPTIGAAVDLSTKVKFENAARERSTTASRLAASLIFQFLVAEAETVETPGCPTERQSIAVPKNRSCAKTEQVFVRLEPYYFDELGRLANERNWYRSTYLANLLHAHVDRKPVMCDVEINAVRVAARQLADIGRSISQIARSLNQGPENKQIPAVDFELVRMIVELEVSAIKKLMSANLSGWGVYDGEA